MLNALKQHWPEYLMEAAELGIFMLSACFFGTLFAHPNSPVVQSVQNPILLRIFMGMAMGTSAILIIYSPLGKRSGAHFNPAVTFAFFRLKKINPSDAAFYMSAQFVGGILGVVVASVIIGEAVADPNVHYVATLPGEWGLFPAFLAEIVISFLMMTMVLHVSNSKRIAKYTGIFAGTLVALYIIIESPISGMSMNPARTLGSAVPANEWSTLWLYFLAPAIGMLSAAELFTRMRKKSMCAKLHHDNNHRCIFRCSFKNHEKIQEDSNLKKHQTADEFMRT
jgi:aquaporin Z